MITIHALPPTEPVLVGPLRMHRSGAIKGRPTLVVEPWCPYCRERHPVGWPNAPLVLDVYVPAKLPCGTGPFAGVETWVGLDDGRTTDHLLLMQLFAQALRRWRVEQKLKHQFGDGREVDRRHQIERDALAAPSPKATTSRA